MKTDYTRCQTEIAESLKCGEHIKCNVENPMHSLYEDKRNDAKIVAYITDYKNKLQYYLDDTGIGWDDAIPSTTEVRVISHISMMMGLLERGYVQEKNGKWSPPSKRKLAATIFLECGKVPNQISEYYDWMLTEVEI